MLKLSFGSVLSTKCDLLLLPCNSAGGYTSWVDFEIKFNGLPKPRGRVAFGSVQFRETLARYPVADFVGFAASVDAATGTSTLDAVSAIAAAVLKYAEATGSSLVNLPILGAGAGGLAREAVLRLYARKFGKSDILFNVYVPDDLDLKLPAPSARASTLPRNPLKGRRVFISYSRADPQVSTWVKSLYEVLSRAGVDARLDQAHLRPGMDLPQWMTNELVKAAKVLLVCDASYSAKADTRSAGVGWETMIIQGDLLSQGTTSTKYIPIAFSGDVADIPIYLRTRLWLGRSEVEADLGRLLRAIIDSDNAVLPHRLPRWRPRPAPDRS